MANQVPTMTVIPQVEFELFVTGITAQIHSVLLVIH